MDTNELVLKVLGESASPLKSAEIADKAGISKGEADKAIKKLVTEGKIISPKRCFYQAK